MSNNSPIGPIGEGIRKFFLLGIGAAANTAEKTKEIVDELVKKGELTVEQGKALNEELKHNIKEKVKQTVNVSVYEETNSSLIDNLDKLSPEEIQALKDKLAQMEGKTDGGEAPKAE